MKNKTIIDIIELRLNFIDNPSYEKVILGQLPHFGAGK